MIYEVLLEDLRTHISYRGLLDPQDIVLGQSLIIKLTNTPTPMGFQVALLRGWIQAVDRPSRLYIFDVDGGKFLLKAIK
jgi:hypothetical protein